MNPRVFLDFAVDSDPVGRVILELFADSVPKTAENFRALCTGEKGISPKSQIPLYFKNSIIHRSIPDFMIQGGDFTKRNGLGGESIYGGPFEDENLTRGVDSEGLLVMANRGPNTNGSQFFITLRPCPHLNGKHVVYGRVIRGYDDVIQKIVAVPTDEKDRPARPVVIINCGELERRKAPAKREPSPSPSPTASESDNGERAAARRPKRKKQRQHASSPRSVSRSPARGAEGDQDRDGKRKRKHKHKHTSKRKSASKAHHEEEDSKEDGGDQPAEPRKETEEEYDARLEREEKARIEAGRKAELARLRERLKREEEERQHRDPSRINYKGRGRMKYVDPEAAHRRYDRR